MTASERGLLRCSFGVAHCQHLQARGSVLQRALATPVPKGGINPTQGERKSKRGID